MVWNLDLHDDSEGACPHLRLSMTPDACRSSLRGASIIKTVPLVGYATDHLVILQLVLVCHETHTGFRDLDLATQVHLLKESSR